MDVRAMVRRTIGKYKMITPGQTVLVAVSGGPDSMALLHLLDSLSGELDCRLAVAHFNHLTRGAESDADEQLVAEVAGRLKLSFYAGRYDVPGAVGPGAPLQVVAREERYRFFRDAARASGAAVVALGHQADDQAETVLQHILRGSGPSGLRGIPPSRGIFVRPLIEVRRQDLLDYLAAGAMVYRLDASNLKTVYQRNRVRLELIPYLESGYNPRVVETLNRLAQLCREDEDFLLEQARAAFARIASRGPGPTALNLAGLAALPGALAGRVVRLAWAEFRANPGDLSYVQARAVCSLAASGRTGGVVQLPGGVRVTRTYTHLVFGREEGRCVAETFLYPLRLPGRTVVAELGCTLCASFLSRAPAWADLPPTEAVLDYARTGEQLYVRSRKNGDLFWPLGLSGRIKLKKFLIDRKVPRPARDRVPLVVTPDDIVWVAGFQPGEPYRVSAKTRNFLHLRLEDTAARSGRDV